MKKLALLAAVASVALSACVSTNESTPSGALQAKVYTKQYADVAVGSKVSAESSAKVIFGFITISEDNKYADGVNYSGSAAAAKGGLLDLSFLDASTKVKSAAAYKALKNSNADVLVAPTYETEVNNFFVFKDIKVKVNAYKGNIKGFTQDKSPVNNI